MPTILIVDDHEEDLELVESVLKEQRYQVVKARNGLEALECARDGLPDLVLADTLMPVMDGFTLCWRWRADERLRRIPFMFLAPTCGDREDERFGLGLGADRYLVKPFEPMKLLQSVQEMLNQPRPTRPRQSLAALQPRGTVSLKEYDETLIHRLESRLAELESANRALRAREECLTGILDTLPDASLTFSEAGNLEWANQACLRLFGYSPEELNGQHVELLLPRSASDAANSTWAEGSVCHLNARRKNGTRFPVQLNVGEVRTDGQRLFVAHIHDLSERERLEAQHRQGKKMEALGRLCGGVAHDFNNLLTIISGYAQLLLNGLEAEDPLRGLAVEIERTVERASELTQQLLVFSRKQVKQPTLLDLNTVIRGMERMLKRLIGENIEFVTKLDPKLGRIRSDPGQMEQVVMNLIVNARDAMPRGGRILLETSNVEIDEHYVHLHPDCRPGPHVQLVVTDTGAGISDEVMSHLFEPFFTTKETGKGTGLGLATVYSIVKQWNGYVTVYSEPNHGAAFKVLLPRTPDSATDLPAPPAVAELPGGSETILLAEDDQDLRLLIGKILVRLGYKVLQAATGAEALDLARAESDRPIHLLISDVVMPVLSGPELAENLVRSIPGLRVLFISGYTGDTVLNRGLLGEGLAFLAKPFTASALASKVRELLDAAPRKTS